MINRFSTIITRVLHIKMFNTKVRHNDYTGPSQLLNGSVIIITRTECNFENKWCYINIGKTVICPNMSEPQNHILDRILPRSYP